MKEKVKEKEKLNSIDKRDEDGILKRYTRNRGND